MQKEWQKKGRWGKQGRRLKARVAGEKPGPVRKKPSQSPLPCSSAESWGPGEEGRGGLICSPAPGGRRAPPSTGSRCAAIPPSSLCVPGQGMSCSRRSLPGARGQGGPGGVSRILPTSSPPRCEPEPPPRPPLTHAAPGLAGRRVWDRVRGWGAWQAAGEPVPPGGRALYK